VNVLRAAGYGTDHRARQITPRELAGVDLALAADRGHLRELRAMTQDHAKVVLLRSFDPAADDDEVPDPYYGPDSGFNEVLAMTQAAAPGVIAEIRRLLHERSSFDRASGAAAGNGR
jgi:protein-tyrosine phosphatase